MNLITALLGRQGQSVHRFNCSTIKLNNGKCDFCQMWKSMLSNKLWFNFPTNERYELPPNGKDLVELLLQYVKDDRVNVNVNDYIKDANNINCVGSRSTDTINTRNVNKINILDTTINSALANCAMFGEIYWTAFLVVVCEVDIIGYDREKNSFIEVLKSNHEYIRRKLESQQRYVESKIYSGEEIKCIGGIIEDEDDVRDDNKGNNKGEDKSKNSKYINDNIINTVFIVNMTYTSMVVPYLEDCIKSDDAYKQFVYARM